MRAALGPPISSLVSGTDSSVAEMLGCPQAHGHWEKLWRRVWPVRLRPVAGLAVPGHEFKHAKDFGVASKGFCGQRGNVVHRLAVREDAIHLAAQPLLDQGPHFVGRDRTRRLVPGP